MRRDGSTAPRYSTDRGRQSPLATITPHVPTPTPADHRRRSVRAPGRRGRRRGLVDRPRARWRRARRGHPAVHRIRPDAAQHRPASDAEEGSFRAGLAALRAGRLTHPERNRTERGQAAVPGGLEGQPARADRVPAVVQRGVLYLGRDDGWLVAIQRVHGKVLWQRRFGPIPDQPAIWQGKLNFGTFDKPGSVYAVDAKTGHVIWRTRLTDQVESSMVVVRRQGLHRVQRRHSARTERANRQGDLEVPRRRCGQGQPGRRRRARVLRRLRRHDVQPPGERRPGAVGARTPPACPAATARATSTPRRRSPTAASTSATPTARCTRSSPSPGRSRGRRRCPTGRTARRAPPPARCSRPATTARSRR